MPSRIALTTVVALASSLACADFKEMLSLQQGLVQEFQTSAISININSDNLTIVFSNSPNANLPEEERAAFARRVGEYVRDHYAGYDHLQRIQVGFASVKGTAGFRITNTQVPYQFSPGELGPPKSHKLEGAPH